MTTINYVELAREMRDLSARIREHAKHVTRPGAHAELAHFCRSAQQLSVAAGYAKERLARARSRMPNVRAFLSAASELESTLAEALALVAKKADM